MLALLFAVPFAIAFRVEKLTERFRGKSIRFAWIQWPRPNQFSHRFHPQRTMRPSM